MLMFASEATSTVADPARALLYGATAVGGVLLASVAETLVLSHALVDPLVVGGTTIVGHGGVAGAAGAALFAFGSAAAIVHDGE